MTIIMGRIIRQLCNLMLRAGKPCGAAHLYRQSLLEPEAVQQMLEHIRIMQDQALYEPDPEALAH